MQKLIVAAVVGVAVLGAVIYANRDDETPEQFRARRNIAMLDQMDQAWVDHKQRPRDPGSVLDPRQFDPLIRDLEAIDLYQAHDDVEALHARFVAFARSAPEFFEELTDGPPRDYSRWSKENEDWELALRNAAIRLENEVEEIQGEIGRLRTELQQVVDG